MPLRASFRDTLSPSAPGEECRYSRISLNLRYLATRSVAPSLKPRDSAKNLYNDEWWMFVCLDISTGVSSAWRRCHLNDSVNGAFFFGGGLLAHLGSPFPLGLKLIRLPIRASSSTATCV